MGKKRKEKKNKKCLSSANEKPEVIEVGLVMESVWKRWWVEAGLDTHLKEEHRAQSEILPGVITGAHEESQKL